MSANKIASYFIDSGIKICGADYIIRRIKQLGLKSRTISESCYLESVSSQKKKTIKEKYGVDNVSQIEEIKEKKRKKCLETYGVDNNFKSDEIKQKIKKFWLTEYGADNVSQVFYRKCYNLTKPHRKVIELLNSINIEHENETSKYFKAYNSILGRNYCPRVDLYVPHLRLVIEIFGCYWHANPKLYKENDIFYTFYGKETAKDIWLRDKIKIDHIKNLGYNIEIIWEDEIEFDYIQHIIEKYENKIHQKT